MKEVLPLYNKTAQQQYQNGAQAPDWSSILGASGAPRRTGSDVSKAPSTVSRPSRTPSAAVSSVRNISTAGSSASQVRGTA